MTLLGTEHSLLIRSKFRSVLQLRLQQRRTREQLADQGIMPPLKSPSAFHEQRRSLERAKAEDYLKHKIRSRPQQSDLVNMHILQDSAAEGSIQSTQMKLKRARLADDLNEKIALRPGPLELVEKNIIPVDSAVKEAIKGTQVSFSKSSDAFAFEEDSSNDDLSPEQARGEESQGSTGSATGTKNSEPISSAISGTTQLQVHTHGSENNVTDLTSVQSSQCESPKQVNNQLPVPTAVKSKSSGDSKNRHKKPKDTKPKVKKLKYHQYIPPDQKAEKSPPPMDSAYARLLQQQQLFLQLQILSQQQQQQHFSYQGIHQAQLKHSSEQMVKSSNSSSTPVNNTPLSSVKTTFSGQSCVSSMKPGPLPSNLDDLKATQAGQKFSIPSPSFCKSSPGLSEVKQPPSYEDAIKQQMTRSQQMDELLDVLIESGEMPANAKEDRSCLQKVPQITMSSGNTSTSLPKSSAAFEQVSSSQLSFDHCPGSSDTHLEVLLNSHSPLGRVSDITLLKMGGEESHFEGMIEGFSSKAADELLTSQEILQTPLSPMETQLSPTSTEGSGLQMSFTESPWETMEWLDLTPPSSTTAFGSLTTAGPSIFNIDFLDVTDLNLNTTMDLHLQQW
ncbi:myocardin isoform X7 [Alligator mississippiensis]|uniref:myocardin isoform X7 n=1 Tax=Alligator mississippiensis TaxID=8496 RepID=UPI0009074144|nr:myocardin isoform X7 [Alligator mississippiensis]